MHAFFVDAVGAPGEPAELERSERDHLFRTLRAAPGDRVRLLDGAGTVGEALVGPGRTLVVERRMAAEAPPLTIHLGCAAPRRQKLDGMLRQLAEVGARSIALMQCSRSVAQPEGSSRWDALLREGCKQSGNPFLPAIRVAGSPEAVLKEWRDGGVAIYFGAVTPPDAPPAVPARGEIGYLVGPEGGFTPEEEALMRAYGAQAVSLGPWILRLETAAVCGVAVLRALAG